MKAHFPASLYSSASFTFGSSSISNQKIKVQEEEEVTLCIEMDNYNSENNESIQIFICKNDAILNKAERWKQWREKGENEWNHIDM